MQFLIKRIFVIFLACSSLALSSFIYADELQPYDNQGPVTDVIAAGQIVILNQQYALDNNTQVHGKMRLGEVGPKIQKGDEVGFNYELKGDQLYITDIWPISFNDR